MCYATEVEQIEDYSVSTLSADDVVTYVDNVRYALQLYDSGINYISSFYSTLYDVGTWGIANLTDITNYRWSDYRICSKITYTKSSNGLIASEGDSFKFVLTSIPLKAEATYNSKTYSSNFNVNNVDYVKLRLGNSSASYFYNDYIDSSCLTTNNDGTINITLSFNDLPQDLHIIDIFVIYHAGAVFSNISDTVYNNCTKYNIISGVHKGTHLQVKVDDGTKGLLSSILGLVGNIKDGVGNIVSGITELPIKIWSFFEDGLKNLFVPSEEDITGIKQDWDNLLSDRFGGLYQSIHLIDDFADSFSNPEEQNTIAVPELTVNLVGSDFTFGGQDVQIIPDKFSFLIDAIKLIIDILATVLFVNGLRNRFMKDVIGGSEE